MKQSTTNHGWVASAQADGVAQPAFRPWRRSGAVRWWLLPLILFGLLLGGPRVHPRLATIELPSVPTDPALLDAWVAAREAAAGPLRADAQARIVWADPAHPARTACVLVYLHGFTASQGEGAPAHRELARQFGCNLYLSRLPGHGLQAADALHGVDANQLLRGAALALAVGHALGDKVVLIGSSMGGALAVQLAASHPDQVAGLLLWSPLVRERDEALRPLLWPWGATYLRYGRNHGDEVVHGRSSSSIWAADTDLDGYAALTALTRGGMLPGTYAKVSAPLFLGYYYRDAAHQDATVSVAAMLDMYDQLATPPANRRKQSFPTAGSHVIASPLRSGATEQVRAASADFLAGVMGWPQHGVAGSAPRAGAEAPL